MVEEPEEVTDINEHAHEDSSTPTTSSAASSSNSTASITSSSEPKKLPKISVIGAGAMGSLVAGKLAKDGGYDVTLISSWEEHVNTINQSG